MKRIIALFSVILILCTGFAGCSGKKPDYVYHSVSLAETPVANEKVFDLTGNKSTIKIDFDLPEAGYIKMLGYDSSDYVEWPEEEILLFVDFKDKDGNVLYNDVEITNGYVDKYLFDAGKVIAEITFKNAPKNMTQTTLSWAFAAQRSEPVELTVGKDAAASADENGIAKFSLVTDSNGVYKVASSEACIYESDCTFRIENENGENVSGDLMIHGTEWTSRTVFLPAGKYTVIVSEISTVASCKAEKIGSGENVILEDMPNLTVPVTFGFTLLNSGERSAKFTADGSAKSLYVVTGGSETYYDSVHTVDAVITDSNGNVVFEETCEDIYKIDISQYKGEYTITLTPNGTCVIEIITK